MTQLNVNCSFHPVKVKGLRKLQNHCAGNNLDFNVISFVNNDNLRIILQKQSLKRRKIDVNIYQTNKIIIQEIWTIYPFQVQCFKKQSPTFS